MVFGTAVAPEHVEAQTTIQTQQGPPPAPNAKAPEYAPPASGAPAGPPAIEPSPGKPSLAPVPGTVDDRGQIRTGAGAWTIFGLRPMTAILVALGLAGLFVLVLGSMARKPARRFPVGHDIDSSSDGGRRNGEAWTGEQRGHSAPEWRASADTVDGVTTSATNALDFAAKMAEVLEQQGGVVNNLKVQ
jgi:hypothetical protein